MCYLVSANNEINFNFATFPPMGVRTRNEEKSALVSGKSRTKKWGLIDKIRFYFFG